MKQVELKKYINEQLNSVNDIMGKHILSIKQLPNPLYMVEPNQSEMKWSDDDNEVFSKLQNYREYLLKIIK